MHKNWQIPRRTFLRGVGTMMALPLLEAMTPAQRVLATTEKAGAFPRRMAFVYVPNGANMADWTPQAVGSEFELPFILDPLKSVKNDIVVLSGLAQNRANPNGDGPGDHARASATFLTGCQARKTSGSDIKVGVSIDQAAARKVGHATRLASLELGCDRSQLSGNCDSGYSCAYSFNVSWRGEVTPNPPETDAKQVFERLFSNGLTGEVAENRAKRARYNQSILDFVLDDASRLKAKLGQTDRRKLDEYMTAVRELEVRIEKAKQFAANLPEIERPSGTPNDYQQHLRLMYDLLAVAFQTDSTRISTFVTAHDGSNRSYPFIGVTDGHHDLSHHQGKEEKKAKISKINRFHLEQFAYFIERLKGIKEGEGTLLDQCMIVYGSGIGDGNRHNHNDLPVVLAGRGGGTIQTGRHIEYPKNTPMTNLYLAMSERLGAPLERLGDSTEALKGLA